MGCIKEQGVETNVVCAAEFQDARRRFQEQNDSEEEEVEQEDDE